MIEQFINKLVCQPWGIDPARGRTLLPGMIQRLRSGKSSRETKGPLFHPSSERPAEDEWGDPLPKMRIEGDVAVIPVRGVLAINLPDWIKRWGLGFTDIDDVCEEFSQAIGDARAQMIALDFDSPGGWSIAGQKLFDFVNSKAGKMSAKPTLAWCADGAEVGSAAFHGATPCDMFLTGRYAVAVGCIGSYRTIIDDTELWKMMGISIDVLRSGEHKGAGLDGWTAEQKAWLQSCADTYGARFRKDVAAFRTHLDVAEMEGQYYDGEQAARRGFTHGVADDLNAAIAKFRRSL